MDLTNVRDHKVPQGVFVQIDGKETYKPFPLDKI